MPPAHPQPVAPAAATRLAAELRIVGVLLFTLFTSLSAQVAVPMPPFGVPQTLQTLAVVLAALCLGPRLGVASMVLYFVVGAIGAGVFAEGSAGLRVILGQTGGYLLGFITCQPVIAALARRTRGPLALNLALASIAGHAVIFTLGVPWLYAVRNADPATAVTAREALFGGFVVFIPGTIIKTALAVLIGLYIVPRTPR
ncbi:MAG: biotin transporter BioY [Leptolyngbya sp. PLA2]|nr:biotin transporter BioY [Leptolyngbya sp.]MCE7971097.1 biotin transporter BioY [Leptolyngbya sp. PL-A2]MCQ3940776.1 biotin transporter BioY [cyanobacterium CYA1]MCZ7634206.1 biotin transporter BioY [Phycisphaerales bacterium]MDL1905091.1 biotin transporter BioY [Synechococcales cyanobacterium CNB]GIK19362.1 MAG: biotin biosynthesis protein BioY [Planctomycetota bacterium]